MAIGNLSDYLSDSKYQAVFSNNNSMKRELVPLNPETSNITNIMSSSKASWRSDETDSLVPDLTDTEQSNDEEDYDAGESDFENDLKDNTHKQKFVGENVKDGSKHKSEQKNFNETSEIQTVPLSADIKNAVTANPIRIASEDIKQLFINDNNVQKQIVMKIIVRIVSNLLITKFPIDECCNNRNNLIINNLIGFIERVLSRSRIPLDHFLISNLLLFRFLNYLNKADAPKFKNNGDKLCLRRLIITSLVTTSKHHGDSEWLQPIRSAAAAAAVAKRGPVSSKITSSKVTKNSSVSIKSQSLQNGLRQYLTTQVWSLISGLPTGEITKLESEFGKFIAYDFKVSASELTKFKGDLNQLVKLIVKSDTF